MKIARDMNRLMKPVARIGDQHICGNLDHALNTIVMGGTGIVEGSSESRERRVLVDSLSRITDGSAWS